jgi:hypothetical protein
MFFLLCRDGPFFAIDDDREVELMRRMFCAFVVTAALAAPLVATTNALAAEESATATIRIRVYDPFRHDYHAWDRNEQRAYRAYLAEHHRSYIAYRRQRIAQRRAYWRWRHEREERLEHRRR